MVRFLWEVFMKFYLIGAVVALVAGAYFAGGRVAHERCRAAAANTATEIAINSANITRIANEKTFNTGLRDIRRILHQKYTIAD